MKFKAARQVLSIEFAQGFVGYALTSFIAIATFRHASWGWIFLMWNVVSLAVGLVLAVLCYDEPLSAKRLAAAALLIGAMVLAE